MEKILGRKFAELSEATRNKLPDLRVRRQKLYTPPDATLLKQTHSICPTCYNIVTADVGYDEQGVWMYKRCPEHGDFKGFIESDVEFYRLMMNRAPVPRMPYNVIVIPVTHQCNLDCALCFVPKRDRHDLSLAKIKKIIDNFSGQYVCVSGGEPTLRDDLPEIIRYICAKGKNAQLFTNAIKLADCDYLKLLMDAGLRDCLFSFNGFSDGVFEKINNKPLLDIKLKAMQNCIDQDMNIALSPTVFKDLNEEDIAPLVKFCLENMPQIYELRVRGACRVGRHSKVSPLPTSQLAALIADALNLEMASLLAEFEPEDCYHSVIQHNIHGVFKEGGNGTEFIGWNPGHFARDCTMEELTQGFVDAIREEKAVNLPDHRILDRYKYLAINVWGWPDAGNLDFQEIHSHGVYHLYDNRKPLNFCEAVLVAEQL